MSRRVVLFPQPLGPSNAKISPGSTSRLSWSSRSCAPILRLTWVSLSFPVDVVLGWLIP